MSDPSKRITVIGFGLMGAQISQVLAQHGYYVLGYDIDKVRLERGLSVVRTGKYGLENSIAKGKLDANQAKKVLENIETTTSLEYALAGASFVLEAAVEDLPTKQKLFKHALAQASQKAVFATNTSTLSIASIFSVLPADARKRAVGVHFFNPPQIMKLVEVVRSRETSTETLNLVYALASDIGKVCVNVLDYPGFVANRIGLSVFAEASELLEKGIAGVRDIDIAMRLGYGYPLGPFELGDLVGLDSRLLNMEALYAETLQERFKPPAILKKLVSEGFLGDPKIKKGSKGGYYEYFNLKKPSET